ncbi:homeobox domain-containing protein [Rutstroemia sp. NJR-2017a BBW]|nr:homeobox domain-containing protein [Rutstroemia sp. NJR-2017a BBW]
MDDATLPEHPTPPRRSPVEPAPPTLDPAPSSDCVSDGSDVTTSSNNSTSNALKEEGSGDSEGRSDGGKQKRKRTSPEDQTFLEAQYKENPKPNKAARAEIVKSVRLNEKEVQNRRQINRRKSRPLLPHEIAAFGLGGMAALSSDPAPVIDHESNPRVEEQSGHWQEASVADPEQEERRSSLDAHNSPTAQAIALAASRLESRNKVQENSPSLSLKEVQGESKPEPTQKPTQDNRSFSITESVSQSFSSTPGYLANRWNAVNSFSTPAPAPATILATPSISQPVFPSSCPGRINSETITPTPSRIRLSTGLDGRAELVEGEITPPRPAPERPVSPLSSVVPMKRMRSLQRSHSALPLGAFSRKSSFSNSFVPRLPSGRSRDARTWEFCCDGEPRDELTTQAENESSGSAVAAISLIRSTSGSALKTNPNKRNTQSRANTSGKRPKMGRASSSVARIQSVAKSSDKRQGNDKNGVLRSPSGDSDKENWLPHETGGNPRRRAANSSKSNDSQQRPILQENLDIPTHAEFDVGKNKRRKATHSEPQVFEDGEDGTRSNESPDDDVERFMRGEVSPSKKGDLDCIQGLLSLSQGNWGR